MMRFVTKRVLLILFLALFANSAFSVNVVLVYKWKLKGFQCMSEDGGANYSKEDVDRTGTMAVNYDTDTGAYSGAQITKYWQDSSGKWVETNDFIAGHAVFESLTLKNERSDYLVVNGFNNLDNAEMYSGKISNMKLITSLGNRVLPVAKKLIGYASWNQTVYTRLSSTGYGDVTLSLDKKSTNTANSNVQTVDTVMREKRSEAASKGFVNRVPVAVDDVAETEMNEKRLSITVLTNDYDPQNAELTVTAITSNPSHGSASINVDGTIDYLPAADWFGVDQFSYMIQNQYGGTDTATVTVTVKYNNTVERVSVDAKGEQFDKESMENSISRNGRFVVLTTKNDFSGFTGAAETKIVLYDRGQRDLETSALLVNGTSVDGGANMGEQLIAKNGKIINDVGTQVVFGSGANNLLESLKDVTGAVSDDTNGVMDVFVRTFSETKARSHSEAAEKVRNQKFPKGVGVNPTELNPTAILGGLPVVGEEDRFTIEYDGSIYVDTTVSVQYLKGTGGWITNLPERIEVHENMVYILKYDTDSLPIGDYEALVTVQLFGTVLVKLTVTDIPMRRISVHTNGAESNGRSLPGSISGDGLQAAYYSEANNLVNNDTNGKWDVFVHDVANAITNRASLSTAGVQSNGDSEHPSLSDNGRYVVFDSLATNLIDGSTLNGSRQIYLHDRYVDGNVNNADQAGNIRTILISKDAAGNEGNGDSAYPEIDGSDASGYYIVYHSAASNLVGAGNDQNGVNDVFMYDVTNDTTTMISVSSDGVAGNGDSMYPSLTADGLHVAFQSEANNLISDDNNSRFDIFLRNVRTGTTTGITRNASGELSDKASVYPSLGTDGNYLYTSFTSESTNLIEDDTNNVADIFVEVRKDINR